MRIVTLIPDRRYANMITADADARMDQLGDVARASGDRRAVAEQAPTLLPHAHACFTGWGTPPLTDGLLDETPDLGIILHCAGSVRNIVPKSVFARGITLCHAAAVIADAVAEFCLLQELLWLRGVHRMSAALKAGVPWSEAAAHPAHLLEERVVGLVGSGYVAQRHIRLLHAFGAQVRVADPYLSAEKAASLGVERATLAQVFGESEIICVHAPKIPETRRMIGANHLASIRPGAILVQSSRSWVMDQEALLRELQTGRFFASLDVFDEEPQPSNSPFFQLDNVVVTPHQAGHTIDTERRQGATMVEELARFQRGEPLQYQILPEMYDQLA
jgi:phosphoglycerate dehydrogenase-like enzyme